MSFPSFSDALRQLYALLALSSATTPYVPEGDASRSGDNLSLTLSWAPERTKSQPKISWTSLKSFKAPIAYQLSGQKQLGARGQLGMSLSAKGESLQEQSCTLKGDFRISSFDLSAAGKVEEGWDWSVAHLYLKTKALDIDFSLGVLPSQSSLSQKTLGARGCYGRWSGELNLPKLFGETDQFSDDYEKAKLIDIAYKREGLFLLLNARRLNIWAKGWGGGLEAKLGPAMFGAKAAGGSIDSVDLSCKRLSTDENSWQSGIGVRMNLSALKVPGKAGFITGSVAKNHESGRWLDTWSVKGEVDLQKAPCRLLQPLVVSGEIKKDSSQDGLSYSLKFSLTIPLK